ncbi:MAG: N-acetylmuramoyl-L-alanine amidase [bacterium]
MNGGRDSGARANGLVEKELNLSLALKVRAELERLGVEVVMSREGDVDVPLSARIEQACRAGVAGFLSIHHNSASNSEARGSETFYQADKEDSRSLASLVQKALVRSTGLNDRGIKTRLRGDGQDYYYILRAAPMAAAICEVGFVTSRSDAARLGTPAFKEMAAAGLASALREFVGQGGAGPFLDVPANHWAVQEVNWVARKRLMNGYPDGLFHGDDPVTRYQLAVALYRLSGEQMVDAQKECEAEKKAKS